MVKLPSLDELKKMGSDLIDQAKSINFGEMVDKVKSGVEFTNRKKPIPDTQDESIRAIFNDIYLNLGEITQLQANQLAALKKIETQMKELVKIIEQTTKKEGPSL